ncbi:hypothetical protein Q4595_11265 [Wenyingzhuangia sp. 1_MG-2023]|nr:hypothetical protein [Wenyingzhuangia sp. 1_MG-2023]
MKNLLNGLIFILLVGCNTPIKEKYLAENYEDKQKKELIASGVDSLSIAMIELEIKNNENIQGLSFEKILQMGSERHYKIIESLKQEFNDKKNDNPNEKDLTKILLELYNHDPKNEFITVGMDYVEKLKFSTINKISIDMSIEKLGKEYKKQEKENGYEVYMKSDVVINGLKGSFYVYLKDKKVKKIVFKSPASWMGATRLSGQFFSAFREAREEWVQNAMAYYKIDEWTNHTTPYYIKNKIRHQYELEKISMLGVNMGWYLGYTIVDENSWQKEQQSNYNF